MISLMLISVFYGICDNAVLVRLLVAWDADKKHDVNVVTPLTPVCPEFHVSRV